MPNTLNKEIYVKAMPNLETAEDYYSIEGIG